MKIWSICIVLLFLTGCKGSNQRGPSSPTPPPPPPPSPVLTLDISALVVSRHETGRAQAVFGLPGAQQDVTAAAVWTSSNTRVAVVEGGVVSAVGLGTASLTCAYQGLTQSVPVTVRRRMLVLGMVLLSDVNRRRTLGELLSFVEGQNVGYMGTSQAQMLWPSSGTERLDSIQSGE